MKIKLSEILDSGLHLVTSREPNWLHNIPELFTEGEDVRITSELSFDLWISKGTGDVTVDGELLCSVLFPCSRCLSPVELKISPRVHLVLSPEVNIGVDADCKTGTDYETYSGEQIDLGDYMREVIARDLPLKVLCAEQCRGLCSECGANLNETQCGCGSDWVDPRFEALKSLKV